MPCAARLKGLCSARPPMRNDVIPTRRGACFPLMKTRLPMLALMMCATMFATGCTVNLFNTLGLSGSTVDQDELRTVLRENPDNPHAWFILGKEQHREGRFSRARRSFERAVEQQPDFVEAQLGVGLTWLEQERWGRAEAAFQRALEIESGTARAYQGIAEARLGARDLAGAEEAANQALALSPTHAPSLRVMGDIRYSQARYAEAAEYWRSSIRHGGDDRRLGVVLEDLERYIDRYQ